MSKICNESSTDSDGAFGVSKIHCLDGTTELSYSNSRWKVLVGSSPILAEQSANLRLSPEMIRAEEIRDIKTGFPEEKALVVRPTNIQFQPAAPHLFALE